MTTAQTLPKGWEKTTLGELCEIFDNKRIPLNSEQRNQRINNKTPDELFPYYGATGEVGKIDDFIFDGEFVLLGEDAAPFFEPTKNVAYCVKGKFWVNNHAHILNSSVLENLYLCHYLNQFNFSGYVSGTTRLKLSQGMMKKIPIIYPTNKETQQAIVNKIESLFAEIDAGIGSLKTAVQQLAQYRQSLLKNAFNGELTQAWREQNADKLPSADELLAQIQTTREQHHAKQLADWQQAVSEWEQNGKEGKKPTKPKVMTQAVKFEKDFADLPKGWLNFLLDELAEISGGLTKNSKRNAFEEKVPYLRVANVYANELKLDEIETIGIQESEKERTLLQLNDLLIVEGNGSIEQIGRVALWNDAIKPCYHQNHLIKARCYPFMLPKFVLYFLMSPMGRKRIIDVASSTTGLHTLSLTKIANLVIPYCSLTEQTQIVAILENKLTACDRLAADLAAQLKQAELLKQSVLKAAFSGKLSDSQQHQ